MRSFRLPALPCWAALSCVLMAVSPDALSGEPVELKYKRKFLVVTEKGELVSKDLKQIVFRKAGAEDTVTIPWADVRSIDGKPAQEVLAGVRKEYGSRICPDCKGGALAVSPRGRSRAGSARPRERPPAARGDARAAGSRAPAPASSLASGGGKTSPV